MDNLRYFCFFVGYPASGHSVVGAHIDAHRNAVVAHEVHAARLICREGYDREKLFVTLLTRARRQAADRHSANHQARHRPHRHDLSTLMQGRSDDLRVIGDKRGGGTSRLARRIGGEPMIEQVRDCVRLPLRVLLVTRNPYDMLTTKLLPDFETGMTTLKEQSEGVGATVAALDDSELLHLRHESMVADPEETLRRICTFLDLEPYPEYLETCTAAIFDRPTRPSSGRSWTSAQVDRVASELIEPFPWLGDYRLETDGAGAAARTAGGQE